MSFRRFSGTTASAAGQLHLHLPGRNAGDRGLVTRPGLPRGGAATDGQDRSISFIKIPRQWNTQSITACKGWCPAGVTVGGTRYGGVRDERGESEEEREREMEGKKGIPWDPAGLSFR